MTATPAKLKSGEWGARVMGRASEGDIITVRAKSGKSWEAKVSRVVWTGRDKYGSGDITTMVETCSPNYTPAVRDPRGYVRDRGHYDGYCGYPCPVSGKKCCPDNGPCHDCL